MALNALKAWLICYDIVDPRRLSRFHRFISKQAVPVQYSVFCYEGSAAQLGRLVARIESEIDPAADDVRIYQVPERLQCDTLGTGSVPADVSLHSTKHDGWTRLIAGASS